VDPHEIAQVVRDEQAETAGPARRRRDPPSPRRPLDHHPQLIMNRSMIGQEGKGVSWAVEADMIRSMYRFPSSASPAVVMMPRLRGC
jgi:hypothetical protein